LLTFSAGIGFALRARSPYEGLKPRRRSADDPVAVLRPPASVEERFVTSGVGLLWRLAASLSLWWMLIFLVERLV